VKIMFGGRSAIVRVLAAGAFVLAGCSGEKTLLAPTGAVLTLVTGATALSFNGSTAINARILTSQGQPAPDGTVVRFATTLGTVAPVEVVTAAGVATTNFNAGVASGTAIVTASSGSVGGDNGLRIAIGVAAVARVQVTATPPSVPFGGGTSVIAAVAIDASNNPLVGIPVTFSTSTGATIAPANLKTDPKGIAEATLTANQRVTVTATAAAAPSDPGFGSVGTTQGSVVVGATPQPVPVVTVIAPPNAVAGTPVPFTIGAVPAPMSNTTITNVSVDFGDGSRVNLGAASGPAISVQHVFTTGGSYTVSVTATDSGGGTSTAAAVIVVGFTQPSTVRITADSIVKIPPTAPATTSTVSLVTFTATLAPATLIGTVYTWTLNDAAGTTTKTTTINQVQGTYTNGTSPTVSVTVTIAGSRQTVDGSLTFIVP
jgi:hypothetical protein